MSYPRRQQFRRLVRFAETAIVAAGLALGAFATAMDGAWFFAFVLSGAAVMAVGMACRWLSLAHRSRIGARSEDAVQRELDVLRAEGWRLRHSLTWRGPGDIDSVAIAPTGIAIAIETKTRRYDDRHVIRIGEQAVWLHRRRRRWARNGSLGVLCLVQARGVERVERDVLVVSIDRLAHVLRHAAQISLD